MRSSGVFQINKKNGHVTLRASFLASLRKVVLPSSAAVCLKALQAYSSVSIHSSPIIQDSKPRDTALQNIQAHSRTKNNRSIADLDGDGIVSRPDISIVAEAFGAKSGELDWNDNADLDKNGTINIIDIYIVAKAFGIIL